MDPEGSPWPVTYRCVPARYSYEFRAGWRALAAAWDLGAGDSVTLTRAGSDRLKLSLQVPWFFSTPLFGGFFPPLSLVVYFHSFLWWVFSTPLSGGFFSILSPSATLHRCHPNCDETDNFLTKSDVETRYR